MPPLAALMLLLLPMGGLVVAANSLVPPATALCSPHRYYYPLYLAQALQHTGPNATAYSLPPGCTINLTLYHYCHNGQENCCPEGTSCFQKDEVSSSL
eukprot:g16726.t1